MIAAMLKIPKMSTSFMAANDLKMKKISYLCFLQIKNGTIASGLFIHVIHLMWDVQKLFIFLSFNK